MYFIRSDKVRWTPLVYANIATNDLNSIMIMHWSNIEQTISMLNALSFQISKIIQLRLMLQQEVIHKSHQKGHMGNLGPRGRPS